MNSETSSPASPLSSSSRSSRASSDSAGSSESHVSYVLAAPADTVAPADAADAAATLVVAVRTLVGFTDRAGDLDLRFTPSPSAEEGIAGHASVRARRAAGYESEVALTALWQDGADLLQVRGRADGFDPATGCLEEIKTVVGPASLIPDNHRALHWAQALIYGAMLCARRGLTGLTLALVYYDIVGQRETRIEETRSAAELQDFFAARCRLWIDWARRERAHRVERDAALATLEFPFESFRPGQRGLAAAVFRTVRDGGTLLAEAPTGIGKTMATLYPALRAAPVNRLDKIHFLTAKVQGRQLARDALIRLGAVGAVDVAGFTETADAADAADAAGAAGASGAHRSIPLRVLELTARDQACEYPDRACHGESCPLAQGFFDRLPAARAAALAAGPGDRAGLRAVALDHQVCPYWLGQDLVRWADVVIGDYNHWFDVSAALFAQARQDEARTLLLIDEAHNLVERARGMYSAALEHRRFLALRRQAPAGLKRPFDRLARAWREALRSADVEAAPPAGFLSVLQQCTVDLAAHFAREPGGTEGATLPGMAATAAAGGVHAELREFQFAALHFLRMAESDGPHALFDIVLHGARGAADAFAGDAADAATDQAAGRGNPRAQPRSTGDLVIRNIVPAPYLAPRFAAAVSAVLFSATLTPHDYHCDMLGLARDTPRIEVPSPFASAQLAVHRVTDISTRYEQRAASVAPIAALIARQYRESPGNYLAFFSSYRYLEDVLAEFRTRHPDIEARAQERGMRAASRAAFLERFAAGRAGVGFAVLGGSFGEAIDLPGERLIGAFIATLGLPQVNPGNERMRARLEALFGAGYAYAYLYPGLQKVVQAAGRVIRGENDHGVLWLIDERYGRAEVLRLLPAWWRPRRHVWKGDAAGPT